MNDDDDEDDDDDDDDDGESDLIDEGSELDIPSDKKTPKLKDMDTLLSPINSDYDSSDNEENFEKFDSSQNSKYINDNHPEIIIKNYEEIEFLSKVTRDENYNIIDEYHKSIPFLTKYEKTRILGQRVNQLDNGDSPYIKVDIDIIDNYLIAEKELQEKVIPVIIKRPINGKNFEYWKLSDLEIIGS